MLQLTPQSRIFLATHPVDFRNGIDGLAAVCRQRLGANPLEGAVYVFRNRAGTALKLLLYDGQGYWLARTVHNAFLSAEDGGALSILYVATAPGGHASDEACALPGDVSRCASVLWRWTIR
jgi:IS66 Orf2 like protein